MVNIHLMMIAVERLVHSIFWNVFTMGNSSFGLNACQFFIQTRFPRTLVRFLEECFFAM